MSELSADRPISRQLRALDILKGMFCAGLNFATAFTVASQEFGMPRLSVDAEPAELVVDTETAALVIIDMQRDFLEPGGFGASLGNDVSLLRAAVAPCRDMLGAARRL